MLVILICVATVKVNLLGELPKGVPLHFSEYFLPDTNEMEYENIANIIFQQKFLIR
jgi:hypothetical protein